MIVLTFSCPDKKGIVAAVSKILFENDANIIESNQYSTNSADNPHFFMRIVFETENLNRLSDINKKLSEFSSAFNAEFKLTDTSVKKKAAECRRLKKIIPYKMQFLKDSRNNPCLCRVRPEP